MISLGFTVFLLLSTLVHFTIGKFFFIEKAEKINFYKLINWAARSVVLGLVLGSLSLHTFELSPTVQINLSSWTILKPYLLSLFTLGALEILTLKKFAKC